jgi:hypothetical protein
MFAIHSSRLLPVGLSQFQEHRHPIIGGELLVSTGSTSGAAAAPLPVDQIERGEQGLYAVLHFALLAKHARVNQMIDGMVAHLEVVAEPDLEALLGVEVVALMQLDLRHEQVTVGLRRINIVQDVLKRAHR